MSQLLNLLLNLTIYSDSEVSNDPSLKDVDYERQLLGIPTDNSFGRKQALAPATTSSIINLARSLAQDATTQYTITAVAGQGNTYRFVWVGGTNPLLRTVRATSQDATTQFTVTQMGNVQRFTATSGTLPAFVANGVVVGDQLNVETNTASPFNPLNQGVFTIVTVAATYLEVLNPSGVAEGPIILGTLTSGLPVFSEYSAAGVQVSDEAKITASAFNIENRGEFNVSKVTAKYFDIDNGTPGIPEGPITLGDASGIVFYPSIYKLLYIESDRKISIRINGDTSDRIEVEPVTAGDPRFVGVFLQRGGVYSLTLANNGLVTANTKIVLSE